MKILRKPLFYGPILFFIIGIPAALFYGKNLIENKLEKGLNYGDFDFKSKNFKIRLNLASLKITADTLWIDSGI